MSMFDLRLGIGTPFEVVALEGREAINDAYRFSLTTRCALEADWLDGLEHEVLGTRATLSLGGEDGRTIHGLVTGIDGLRVRAGGQAEVVLELEPRLALLRLRRRSRIFQEQTLPAIVSAVLDEWGIAHDLEIRGPHRLERYVTQYDETDFAFFQRLVARAGLFYFFEQPNEESGEEKLVIGDSVATYRALASDALRFAPPGDALVGAAQYNDVLAFDRNRRLRPKQVLLADFDPRRPNLPLRAEAKLDRAPSAASGELLVMAHHAQRGENEPDASPFDLDENEARTVLAAHRSGVWQGIGESRIRRLEAGRTFTLHGHPIFGNNRPQVITRIDHRGRLPETGGEVVYSNVFETTIAETPALLPPLPNRRRQVAETATVVGPADEEIFSDALGRVKVRFHWDTAGQAETSSCWVRVAQAWAGTHFGVQFIPRVGMEVVVTFLGGDPDRPIVTGAVYNGTHPTPFELPEERGRSGIRTQSTPSGDGGYSELSFRDDAGSEQVLLRAERDLDVDVGGRHQRKVAGNEAIDVRGSQTAEVGGDRRVVVTGQSVQEAIGGYQLRSRGSGAFAIGGDADFTVGSHLTTRIEGTERRDVKGSVSEQYADDVTVRVLGHHTTVVGRHDARRSFTIHSEGLFTAHATGTTLLSSDKEVVIACGESQLRLGPEGIELRGAKLRIDAPTAELAAEETLSVRAKETVLLAAKKILLESESAALGLAKVAKLDGEKVKINCQPDPVDDLAPIERPKPTIIELADEKGRPLGKQRFIVILPDGSEQSGLLDEEGRAELVLEGSGQIVFPDVDEPQER